MIKIIGYNIPDKALAIHGTVYITYSSDDHFVLIMGTLPLCTEHSCSLWTLTKGTFAGTPSIWNISDNIMLTYPGQLDGFTSYYGMHYTSLTIPITLDKKLYWSAENGGRNTVPNNGGFILFVRGYYAP